MASESPIKAVVIHPIVLLSVVEVWIPIKRVLLDRHVRMHRGQRPLSPS